MFLTNLYVCLVVIHVKPVLLIINWGVVLHAIQEEIRIDFIQLKVQQLEYVAVTHFFMIIVQMSYAYHVIIHVMPVKVEQSLDVKIVR